MGSSREPHGFADSSIAGRHPSVRVYAITSLVILLLALAGLWLTPPQSADEALQFLRIHPGLAFSTTLLGVVCIYAECLYPGLVIPGTLGSAGVLLGATALSGLPLSPVGAGLLLLSAFLFATEAWRPIWIRGLAGSVGTLALSVGAMHLVDNPDPEAKIPTAIALVGSTLLGAVTMVLLSLAARARRNKKTNALTAPEAVALDRIDSRGRVRLHGEIWNAVSRQPIAAGTTVKVCTIRDLTLEVEPLGSTNSDPTALARE